MSDAFSPTSRTLPIALLRAREAVMEHFRPMLQKHGITEQQWRVLRVIREAGETDASELARNACILAPSLSRILKTLEAADLITLRKDPADGRRALMTASLAGFGRAIGEVGAIMIVGGNIDHATRVLTTAIALETGKGDFALALALGFVLIALAIAVNLALHILSGTERGSRW